MKFADPIAWEASLPIRPSTLAWRACIKAIYGSPLTPEEHTEFLARSGGREPPEGGALEALAVVGRRGGKTDQISRLVTFEALHGGHEVAAAPGQRLVIPVVCPLREQAREMIRYVSGLAGLPTIKGRVAAVTADGVEFRNGVAIVVMTADAVALSGVTSCCAVRDEWAKFPGKDATTPDTEIEASLRPTLAPIAGAPPRRLIGITSAYVTSGLAFKTDQENFGRADAPVLVMRGTSIDFCPSIDRAWLERERKRAPEAYDREYLGVWQAAITEGWFGRDVVEAAIDRGRRVSPFEPGRRYFLAIDAAFKHDLFAWAVCTSTRGKPDPQTGASAPRRTIVSGCWALKPSPGKPLSPAACVERVLETARAYHCTSVALDQFCAEPLKEAFKHAGVTPVEMTWTAQSKPARFRSVREAMLDGAFRLPEDPELVAELHAIRGELLQSGGERIEAARGSDDRVSAVVLAASAAMAAPTSNADAEFTRWELRDRERRYAAVGRALGGGGNFDRIESGLYAGFGSPRADEGPMAGITAADFDPKNPFRFL